MKKIFALMLTLILALSLFACGEEENALFDGFPSEAAQTLSDYLKSNGFEVVEGQGAFRDRVCAYRWDGKAGDLMYCNYDGLRGGGLSGYSQDEGVRLSFTNDYDRDPDTNLVTYYNSLLVGEGAPDGFVFPLGITPGTIATELFAIFGITEDLTLIMDSPEAEEGILLFSEGVRTVSLWMRRMKDGTPQSIDVVFSETEGEYVDETNPSFERTVTFAFSPLDLKLLDVCFQAEKHYYAK